MRSTENPGGPRRKHFLLTGEGWPYLLVPLIPVAVVLELVHAGPTWVFLASALGMIPTAALMGRATEELSARSGPGIGGFLNVTFGNAPAPEVRELRELVRHRAKLVMVRSGFKAGVHAVLAKQGLHLPVGDLFGPAGRVELAAAPLDRAYRARVNAYLRLVDALDVEITLAGGWIAARLATDPGYRVIQQIPGVGPTWAAVFVAEIGDVTRFASARHLCSWAGLTPRHRESDTTVHRGPITKMGCGGRRGGFRSPYQPGSSSPENGSASRNSPQRTVSAPASIRPAIRARSATSVRTPGGQPEPLPAHVDDRRVLRQPPQRRSQPSEAGPRLDVAPEQPGDSASPGGAAQTEQCQQPLGALGDVDDLLASGELEAAHQLQPDRAGVVTDHRPKPPPSAPTKTIPKELHDKRDRLPGVRSSHHPLAAGVGDVQVGADRYQNVDRPLPVDDDDARTRPNWRRVHSGRVSEHRHASV